MATLSPTLELACALIERPSVTPRDEGCQDLMMKRLAACGFQVEPMDIEDVQNFWALRGDEGPVLCFAGIPTWCLPGRSRPGPCHRSPPASTTRACCSAAAPPT